MTGTSVGCVTTQISAIHLTKHGQPDSMSSSPSSSASSPLLTEECLVGATQLPRWTAPDWFSMTGCEFPSSHSHSEYFTMYLLFPVQSLSCRWMESRKSCLMSWKMPVVTTVRYWNLNTLKYIVLHQAAFSQQVIFSVADVQWQDKDSELQYLQFQCFRCWPSFHRASTSLTG